jgi:hypothetical protein
LSTILHPTRKHRAREALPYAHKPQASSSGFLVEDRHHHQKFTRTLNSEPRFDLSASMET